MKYSIEILQLLDKLNIIGWGCILLTWRFVSGSKEAHCIKNNHYLMACHVGRKDVTSSHWLVTIMPPIMCGIGPISMCNGVPQ